jgi:hypothetical protein
MIWMLGRRLQAYNKLLVEAAFLENQGQVCLGNVGFKGAVAKDDAAQLGVCR